MIGATPVYADVDPGAALLTTKTLEPALDGASAVIVTHLFGAMADLTEIASECGRRGIRLIEDCAQALGGSARRPARRHPRRRRGVQLLPHQEPRRPRRRRRRRRRQDAAIAATACGRCGSTAGRASTVVARAGGRNSAARRAAGCDPAAAAAAARRLQRTPTRRSTAATPKPLGAGRMRRCRGRRRTRRAPRRRRGRRPRRPSRAARRGRRSRTDVHYPDPRPPAAGFDDGVRRRRRAAGDRAARRADPHAARASPSSRTPRSTSCAGSWSPCERRGPGAGRGDPATPSSCPSTAMPQRCPQADRAARAAGSRARRRAGRQSSSSTALPTTRWRVLARAAPGRQPSPSQLRRPTPATSGPSPAIRTGLGVCAWRVHRGHGRRPAGAARADPRSSSRPLRTGEYDVVGRLAAPSARTRS